MQRFKWHSQAPVVLFLAFCLLELATAKLAQAQSGRTSDNPASSFVAAFRTPAHVKLSSPFVFNDAVDGVIEFLRSSKVVLANDALIDPSRSIIRMQENMSREDLLVMAKSGGATHLLLITVDRPTSKWLKLQLECFDSTGKLLWQEQASYGGGVAAGSAVPKTLERLELRIQARFGQPGLRIAEPSSLQAVENVPVQKAQANIVPSWPDIHFTACPAIATPRAPSQLTWKHGQSEQADYAGAMQMLQAKNYDGAGRGFVKFADEYPDSDYREMALIGAMAAMQRVRDVNGQVQAVKILIELPAAQATTRVGGYVTLSTILSPYVLSTDPEKARKARDLEHWGQCGLAALREVVRPENIQVDAFEKNQQMWTATLDRTLGFASLLKPDYRSAITWLKEAARLNPIDPLTCLWLSTADLNASSPEYDLNGGVFYLARTAELAPQAPSLEISLKQVYVAAHGSATDFEKLKAIAKANTTPPPGFNVLDSTPANPSRATQVGKEHSRAATIAAVALVGLLAYAAVKCPDCFTGGGTADVSAIGGSTKTMIFGGPGHQTYLGCLSCSENAPDSVSNDTGRNGSRDSAVSIWNHYTDYGSLYSQFSACNPDATDPPVIVDDSGNFYGRVTVNQYATGIGTGAELHDWLVSTVCAN
jgi:hypothetical protein